MSWGEGDRRTCGEWRERERDRRGAKTDRGRAEVHPRIPAEAVEDPAADDRPERHPEAGHHGGGAEHRAEDALAEVLARKHRIERHDAAVGEAERRGNDIELAKSRRQDEGARRDGL